MSNTQAVFQLLQSLEKDMPWTVEKLQKLLGGSFKRARTGERPAFELERRVVFSGLVITHLRLTPGDKNSRAELELDENDVDEHDVAKRLPKGYWLPPPPPGYGGVPDARVAYVAERSWGQIWFAFTGSGLRSVSFGVGQHGSPGV